MPGREEPPVTPVQILAGRHNNHVRVLADADVLAVITPRLAVEAARECLLAAHHGTLIGPPRVHVPAGPTDLVFTVGGLADGPAGFRVYGLWPGDSDQIVAVWHGDGRLAGVVTGTLLGAFRTGALGAVALDALAPAPLRSLAIVGTGVQAWTQLWASSAVRQPDEVRVYSRDPERRAAFARRGREELGLSVRAAASAREAVEGAEAIILATTARQPAVESAWLDAALCVSTVGPKFTDGHELPLEVISEAELVVSDSPIELSSLDDPLWNSTPITHLGQLVAEGSYHGEGCRIFASAGLAGSEVLLAQRLLAASSGSGGPGG
jgi:ornithine cyclodeaminase